MLLVGAGVGGRVVWLGMVMRLGSMTFAMVHRPRHLHLAGSHGGGRGNTHLDLDATGLLEGERHGEDRACLQGRLQAHQHDMEAAWLQDRRGAALNLDRRHRPHFHHPPFHQVGVQAGLPCHGRRYGQHPVRRLAMINDGEIGYRVLALTDARPSPGLVDR